MKTLCNITKWTLGGFLVVAYLSTLLWSVQYAETHHPFLHKEVYAWHEFIVVGLGATCFLALGILPTMVALHFLFKE